MMGEIGQCSNFTVSVGSFHYADIESGSGGYRAGLAAEIKAIDALQLGPQKCYIVTCWFGGPV